MNRPRGPGHLVPPRPVLVGAADPHSDDPAHALAPDPPGSSGLRLWKMIDQARGMGVSEYLAAFDRRNLCRGRKWVEDEAVHAGTELRVGLTPGSTVVLLGRDVWRALRVGGQVGPRQKVTIGEVRFYFLPHPSGLTRYYNDAMARWDTGAFLSDMVRSGS